MSKLHCISYASNIFLNRRETFLEQAKNFNRFDTIKVYSEEDLDVNFRKTYENILSQTRGGGYWIWKPQIIKQHLELLNDNDILFYTDVGCTFVNTTQTQDMFNNYLEIIEKNNILRFVLDLLEKEYTNSSAINFFSKKYKQDYSKLADTKHLMATIMGFKKSKQTIHFIEEFFSCLKEDPYLITDNYNDVDRYTGFKDHRHDQSLFSLLYKSLDYNTAIQDHTWAEDFTLCKNIPILATRLRY